VLLPVTAVGEAAVTAVKLAFEGFLTSMRPLMYLQVLTPREHLAAPGERARERLLPGMHPHVVHQLVLGLEGSAVPRTSLPVARVVRLLRPTHVLHGDVRHDLVHGREDLVAGLPGLRLLHVDPEARVLLFDGVAHEGIEGARAVRAHVHAVVVRHGVHVAEVVVGVAEVVGARVRRHLVELVGAGVGKHLGVDVWGGEAAVVVLQPREQHVTARRLVVSSMQPHAHAGADAEHPGVWRRRVVAAQGVELFGAATDEEVPCGVAADL